MQIIKDLLDYVNNDKSTVPASKICDRLDQSELRVIVFNILGWLKFQKRWHKDRPLELKSEFAWCRNLRALLDDNEPMRSLFEISENQLDFRSEIDEATRESIRSIVDAGYNPKIRTSPARAAICTK